MASTRTMLDTSLPRAKEASGECRGRVFREVFLYDLLLLPKYTRRGFFGSSCRLRYCPVICHEVARALVTRVRLLSVDAFLRDVVSCFRSYFFQSRLDSVVCAVCCLSFIGIYISWLFACMWFHPFPLLAILGPLPRWQSTHGGYLKAPFWLLKHTGSSRKCAVCRAGRTTSLVED